MTNTKSDLYLLSGVTLIVLPWFLIDAMTLPKYGALVLLGTILSLKLIKAETSNEFRLSNDRSMKVVFMGFFIIAISSFALNGSYLTQIFGDTGRNTGIVTYFAFGILFAYIYRVASLQFSNSLLNTFLFLGTLTSLYFIFQKLGLDFAAWEDYYSTPSSFLGNPNFVSSFCGMSLGLCLINIFSEIFLMSKTSAQISLLKNFPLLLNIIALCLLSLVVLWSNSVQGYLCAIIVMGVYAACTVSSVVVKRMGIRNLTFLTFGSFIAVFCLVYLAVLLSEITGFLDSPAVQTRLFFWQAAFSVIREHPLLGTGFDSFGDLYRSNRSAESISYSGENVVVNAAHNVLLDLAINGGVGLALLYLSIFIITVYRFLKIFFTNAQLTGQIKKCFALMAAFFVQSLISMNQISLALWGTVFTASVNGLIFRDHFNTSDSLWKKNHSKVVEKFRYSGGSVSLSNQSFSKFILQIGVVCLGVVVALAPIKSDFVYRESLYTADLKKIQDAAFGFPTNSSRLSFTAKLMCINGDELRAREVLDQAVQFNPRDFESWTMYLRLPDYEASHKRALEVLKTLDPRNPNFREGIDKVSEVYPACLPSR